MIGYMSVTNMIHGLFGTTLTDLMRDIPYVQVSVAMARILAHTEAVQQLL